MQHFAPPARADRNVLLGMIRSSAVPRHVATAQAGALPAGPLTVRTSCALAEQPMNGLVASVAVAFVVLSVRSLRQSVQQSGVRLIADHMPMAHTNAILHTQVILYRQLSSVHR